MANEVRWITASATACAITADMNALAPGANASGVPISNGSILARYIDYELYVGSASVWGAGGAINLYHVYSLDGTLYPDGGATASDPHSSAWVAAFPLRAASPAGSQRIALNGIMLSPFDFKPVVEYVTGSGALSSVNELRYRLSDEEIQ